MANNITNEVQDQLISMVVGMHGAAPGKKILSDLAALYNADNSLAAIAATLGEGDLFTGIYPTFLTNQQFATNFVNNVVGSLVSQEEKDWAVGVLTADLNAGASRGEVAYSAILALREVASTEPNWGDASAAFANKMEVATYYTVTKQLDAGTLAELQEVIADVDNTEQSVTDAKAEADGTSSKGQTYSLTTGVDTLVGTSANDTFNAANTTFTALDSIDGGAGADVLNVNDVAGATAIPGGIKLSNVETLNWASAGTVAINTSGSTITGLEKVNITNSTGTVSVTAASGQAVDVVGSGGLVTLSGGASQTVASSGGVTLSGSKGAITVTDTAQGAQASTINGGTDVTLTTTSNDTTNTAHITIGNTAVPTGEVTVVQNAKMTATGTAGDISIKGGSEVDLTINSSNSNGNTTTAGAISIDANGTAKSVSVTQSTVATAAATAAAVAAVTETASAKFVALAAGDTLVVDGLTFTAGASGTTAAQTAAAFANLSATATQGNSTLGTYQGTFGGNWTTGAASTDTVVFTSTAAGNVGDLTFAGTGTAPTLTITQGVAASAAAGRAGVVNGAVTITDGAATDVLESVSVNEYGANASVTSDALKTLSLANSGAGTFSVTNTKQTTLDLTVNDVDAGVNIGGTYTTVNATATGTNSVFSLTAGGVTTLNVAGDKLMNLSGAALGALKTVAVSESASLTLNAGEAGTLTSVNSSATTGTVTATIDSTKATYTGGAGVDNVTFSNTTAASKAVSLGGGNDKLTLATGTAIPTATLNGGEGTDTLSMTASDAVTQSGSTAFSTKVIGFEVLEVTGAAGAQAIDLEALGNYNSVSSAGTAGTLTLNKMASGGTLTITGATTGGHTVAIKDAATGTADVLNVVVSSAASLAGGTVTAANVETINITSTDTTTPFNAAHTLTLVATKATTVDLAGNAALTLTNTGNTAQTAIDASDMTGALTVTAAGTTATTITGGSGNDNLTASTGTVADTLIGGAGNDTLTSNQGLTTLTGGAGADTFVIVAPANLNSYSTITDASAGDKIQLPNQGTETFQKSAVTLAATAVFQDYANAAVNAGGDASTNGYIAWFQFGGDTYIVQSNTDKTTTPDFQNGTDVIVKLSGLVDLSSASLNTGTPTLLLG